MRIPKIDIKKLNFFELAGFLFLFIGCLLSVINLKDYLSISNLVDTMKETDGIVEAFPTLIIALGYVAVGITSIIFIVFSLLGKSDFRKALLIPLIVLLINVGSIGLTLIGEASKGNEITFNLALIIVSGISFALITAAWYFKNPKQLITLIIYSVIAVALITKDIIRLTDSFDIYFIFEMIALITFTLGYVPFPFNKKEEEQLALPQNN